MKISKYSKFLAFLFFLAIGAGTGGECWGAVIFEDNFDSQADWNVSGQYEGNECNPNYNCGGGTYPIDWNFYRTVPGASGLNPVTSIRRLPGNLPDHTTGVGKANVIYSESVEGVNWPGDGILGKYFGSDANYQELYIRFWARTQSNWQFVPGGLVKVFRLFNWRGTSNIFQWADESSPGLFFDFAIYNGNANYAPSYRCDQLPYDSNGRSADYYCGNNQIPSNGVGQAWGGVPPTSGYADMGWHRYDFYAKMNTIGSANGTYKFTYDGNVLYNITNVKWKESASPAGKGWNGFALGGNSANTWASKGEQWYAIDDVVISTASIPADYVIGGGAPPDTTAPNAPGGLLVR